MSTTKNLLRLAAPVVASQAAGMMVNFADTFMVGKLGDAELGTVSFSCNLTVVVMFFGIGVAASITPAVGRRYGRGDMLSIGKTIGHARRMNFLVLAIQLFVLALMAASIPFMGQPEEVARMAQFYLPILAASMVGQQLFTGARTIVEGLQDTATPMRISLVCNVLNIVGNYFLIFGVGPWPGLGVYGAAVSTLVARTIMWIWMEVVLRRRLKALGIEMSHHARRGVSRLLFFSGLPVGAQSVVECVGFTMCGIMMGWIGTEALAAHQVVNLFTSLTYLMASGIASAVTIKVSVSCGAADRTAARRYALCGLSIVALFMLSMGVFFVCSRNWLPGLVIQGETAIDIAAQLMIIGALFQIFDGLQVTAIGALRGYGDLRFPAVAAAVAFALTTIPVAYLLGFVCNLSFRGIWYGTLVGLLVASALLVVRLHRRFNLFGVCRNATPMQ